MTEYCFGRYQEAEDMFDFLNYQMQPYYYFHDRLQDPKDIDVTMLQLENCPDRMCRMQWLQNENGMCQTYNSPTHREAYTRNKISEMVEEMIDSETTDRALVKNSGSGRVYRVRLMHLLQTLE